MFFYPWLKQVAKNIEELCFFQKKFAIKTMCFFWDFSIANNSTKI
jgi:hypothetical protein